MKKFVSAAMALLMTILSFSFLLSDSHVTSTALGESSLFGTMTAKQIIELHPAISNYIKNGLVNHEGDISMDCGYAVSSNHIEEIYRSLLYENPELFYIDPHMVDISILNQTGNLISIRPTYLYSKDEIPQKQVELNNAVNTIVNSIGSDWTDVEKCRYVHDMIALNCKFYENNDSTTDYSVFTAYGALINGEAYCEGYTLAYNYIMRKLGYTCYFIQSPTVNHAWSLINVDGYYYHVDVAYDDPAPDTAGRVFHDYCLVSDGQMNAYDADENNLNKHTGWISAIKADNDKYNLAWWRNVETAIFTIDGYDYYINHLYGASKYGALLRHQNDLDLISEVNKIESRWYVEGQNNTFWMGNYSYLSYDGKHLYYNDTANVYRIAPDSTQRELYYKSTDDIPHYIYGFKINLDGSMYISSKPSPNDKDELYKIEYNANTITLPTASTNPSDPAVSTLPTGDTTTITFTPEVKIPVSKYSKTFAAGKSFTMSVSGLSKNQTIKYSSSDSSIVKVTSKGKMYTLKKGKATVKMTVRNQTETVGIVKCNITVKNNPKLSKPSITVKKGAVAKVSISGKVSAIDNKYYNTKYAKF
ncbi:MAG: Ig-like domain-containing protein, partial [Ruminococcus sp.]